MKTKSILGCTRGGMSSRKKEVIVPSPPQLCLHNASSGVLHPESGSPAQRRHGAAITDPEEVYEDYQRTGTFLL